MAVFATDCPHCGVTNCSFQIISSFQNPVRHHVWNLFANCPGCHYPICAVLSFNGKPYDARDPSVYPVNLSGRDSPYQVNAIYPTVIKIDMPEGIPENVAKAFRQAAETRKSRHFDAAAAMYRKSMELGLKEKSPEIAAWKIEKRIDQMAEQGLITKELQEWAHELRLDGNDAVHAADATAEVVDQMHNLCKFLLIYLYTLPEQVKEARQRREPTT